MKVVTTLHRSSAVLHSLKCNLSAQAELGHLVIAKINRIEVSSIQAEGLKPECSLEIWGRVVSIRAVPSETAGTSNLLVLTDHPDPKLILLELTSTNGASLLKEKWSQSLYDRNSRPAEYLTDIVVHPAGKAAVISCYVGKLRVLTFKNGKVDSNFDIMLREHNLLSVDFLYAEPNAHTHTLALVHIDHKQRIQLLARELDIDAMDLCVDISSAIPHTVLPANHFPFTESPLKLVSIPPFDITPSNDAEEEEERQAKCRGGVLILGGRKINFYELSDKRTVRELKNKDARQKKRRESKDAEAQRVADRKEAERAMKKVKPRATVKWPWSEVAAWCPADEEMRRFIIGDVFGRLSMLILNDAPELIIIPLGEASTATSLSYLSSQVLYLGSMSGDSQLLRISPTPLRDFDSETLPIPGSIQTISPSALSAPRAESPDEDYDMRDAMDTREGRGGKVVKCKGSFIQVLSRYQNIAPILDAILADPDESGQPQIITCSGGGNSGSLNLVRTGADFQELAVLRGIPHVTGIFPIKAHSQDSNDSYFLASTLYESYLFRFDSRDAVSRIEAGETALITDQSTLALSNVPARVSQHGRPTYVDSSLVVQVTPQGINVVEYDAVLGTFSKIGNGWNVQQQSNPLWRSREIVAASINPTQVAIGLSGGAVILFGLNERTELVVLGKRQFSNEIAAISCAPLVPTSNRSPFVAVSFWESNTISLLATDDINNPLSTNEKLIAGPFPALPRSLLLHNFGMGVQLGHGDYCPYIVAGLADGTVAAVSILRSYESLEHSKTKVFSLGAAPVSLSVCHVDGEHLVVATGSRSAVLSFSQDRVRQSPVTMKNIAGCCSLNTASFPSCQMLATPTSLVIGQIRGVDKMQIRSIPFGLESPRRITYHPTLKAFGVSTLRQTPNRVGEAEVQESVFRVMDATTFERLDELLAEPDEEITAVHSVERKLVGKRYENGGLFLVGTMRQQIGEYEPSSGRLLLLLQWQGELKKVAEAEAGGCVYALVSTGDFVAAAVNTSVDLYAVLQDKDTFVLKKVAAWNHNYFVTSLVAKGNTLIVGDAISSVSMLEVVDHNLRTVARDYGPVWPTAVESTRDGGVIGANADGNLFTFALPENGGERRVLERNGNYHLGEMVNKFVAGTLNAEASADGQAPLFETEQLFFTSAGTIGLVHHVSDAVSLELTAIQRNMAGMLTGPGQTKHNQWRTPVTARGRSDAEDTATGFLDGDFLERFLTHEDPASLLKGRNAAENIALPVEQVESMLEKLQSLH